MRKTIAIASISALFGAACSQWIYSQFDPPRASAQETPVFEALVAGPQTELTPDEQVNVAVYQQTNRSVVNINTITVRGTNFFFREVPSEGAGSGCVFDQRGYILTNYHVVEGARQIEVTIAGGGTYPADLVGADDVSDVAVLKIDAPPEELVPLNLGDSSSLLVGQKVFVLGNPFGLERTITTGIISSLNRTLPTRNHRTVKSIIQVDAAMNPGNSGGPLLDSRGRMIGMNTAIASKTGQNTGVGFAIPVNRIKRVVDDLIRYGKVTRPDIGIDRVLETEQGLLVATLRPEGPAEQAGIQGFRVVRKREQRGGFVYTYETVDRSSADLIVEVDGEPIRSVDEFLDLVEQHKPGEQTVLTVVRKGQRVRIPVRLVEAP